MSNAYDPFTYLPKQRAFFVTGFKNRDLPNSAAVLANEQPELANHLTSVWDFSQWMKRAFPDMYNIIANKNPEILDPASVVTSGALSPADKGKSSLAGYNEYGDYTPDSVPAAASVATDWGTQILSTIKSTVPAFLQLKTQNDLMQLNIKRAEQGLPPIDSSTLAPTFNIGASQSVQTMGYVAIGGLMLFGLMSVLGKKKRR